jgi:hypothetical protein
MSFAPSGSGGLDCRSILAGAVVYSRGQMKNTVKSNRMQGTPADRLGWAEQQAGSGCGTIQHRNTARTG